LKRMPRLAGRSRTWAEIHSAHVGKRVGSHLWHGHLARGTLPPHGLPALSLPTTFVQNSWPLLVVTPCHVGLFPVSMLPDRPAPGTRGGTPHSPPGLVQPPARAPAPAIPELRSWISSSIPPVVSPGSTDLIPPPSS